MKSLLALAFIVTITAFLGNAVAEEKAYAPKDIEELYGIWVNPDYNTTGNYAKMIFNRDGTWASYLMDSDPDPTRYGKFTITNKWTDLEGNIWFKERHHYQIRAPNYRLMRLSSSGKTLEIAWSGANYPSELDPNNKFYGIYQRLAEQEVLYGTWVNPDYNTETSPAKTLLNPDGTSLSYWKEESTLVAARGNFSITDKWSDSEGNVWYKTTYTWKMGGYSETGYELARISNSGKTYEYVSSRAEYPKELSPKDPSYKIYHRQQ